MTTCQDLIDETRRYLFSGQRETLNVLSGAINNSVTTITLTYDLNALAQGSYVAIDLEIMYVFAVSTTAKTATVQRGMLGSTAASHSDQSLVYVNSKFPAFSIFQALNADLDDLCSPSNGLYQTVDVNLTYNPAVQGYDLTGSTDVLDILSVRTQVPGPSKDWVPLRSWRLETEGSTTDFASGNGIILYEPGSAGMTIRVTYSAPFTHFTSTTDNVTVTGLPTTASDIPPLGAAMRLVGVRETQRNFNESQGDTRRASEVPPNAQLAGMSALVRLRTTRIKSESEKLASTWPNMRRGIMR